MSVAVRPIAEDDIEVCARINRAAFSKFIGIEDPYDFRAGADVIGPRWRAWPEGGFVAEVDGEPAGASLMMQCGSVCVVGPVMVHPDYWGRGLARALMEAMVGVIDAGKFAFAGLYTFPQSATHVRLYEQFGFVLNHLTAVMSKPPAADRETGYLFSTLDADGRRRALAGARAVAESIYPAFNQTAEIRSIADEELGDTIFVDDSQGAVTGFACCHHGAGSEASRGQLFVKFAAVRSGRDAAAHFRRLIEASEGLAAARGADRIVAGVNTGRAGAYRTMRAHGFRSDMNGVAMHRPACDGYNTPRVFAIDDWR